MSHSSLIGVDQPASINQRKQTSTEHHITQPTTHTITQYSYKANIALLLVVAVSLTSIALFATDNTFGKTKLSTEPDDMTTEIRAPVCGGATGAKEPDERTEKVAAAVKPMLEAKTGKKYSVFKPVKTSTQVVAGTNHFIKVLVDEAKQEFVHLRVYEHFSGSIELSAFQEGKTASDEIGYFEA